MKKLIILLFLSVLVTACGVDHKPVYMRFGGDKVSSDHSPDFQRGWNDGCFTGEATYSNQFTKAFRDYKRDPNMVGNVAYESAWYDAYHWCRQSHNTHINNWESDWWGLLTLK